MTGPPSGEETDPLVVPTREGTIKLGQFLKLADLVDQGSDAKALVGSGGVLVNGRVETRRGRQLIAGDIVTAGGRSARVG